jgi:hypothetical protein
MIWLKALGHCEWVISRLYGHLLELITQDLKPPIIIAPTSTETPLADSIIVASGNTISFLDSHFAVERSFVAWEGNGRATALIEAGGVLVAIGEDESSRHPVLKIWDLSKEERKRAGGGPVLMRNVRIQHGQRPHPVSCCRAGGHQS